MKSTDKLTKEQVIIHATGYARGNKCDLVVFECPGCGYDFMLKSKADKSGIQGTIIKYGKKEITIINENKTVSKVKTSLDKVEEKKPQKKVKKIIDPDKTESEPKEV